MPKRYLLLSRPLSFFLLVTFIANVWVFFSAAYGAITMHLFTALGATSICTVTPAIVELTTPFLTQMFVVAFVNTLWLCYILKCNSWRYYIVWEFFFMFITCLILLSVPFFVLDYWSVKYTVQATDSFLMWNFKTPFNFTPLFLREYVGGYYLSFFRGNSYVCFAFTFTLIFINRIFFSHFISIRYSNAVHRNFPFFFRYFLKSYRWFYIFFYSDGDSAFRAIGGFIFSLVYYLFSRFFFHHLVKYAGVLYHKGYVKAFIILFPIFFWIHYMLVFLGPSFLYLVPLMFIFIFSFRILFIGFRSLYFDGFHKTFSNLHCFFIYNILNCPSTLLKFIIYYNPHKLSPSKRSKRPSWNELVKLLDASSSYGPLFALMDKTKKDFSLYPSIPTTESKVLRKWRLIKKRENFRSVKNL